MTGPISVTPSTATSGEEVTVELTVNEQTAGYGFDIASLDGRNILAQGSGLTSGGGTITISVTLGSGPPGPYAVQVLLQNSLGDQIVVAATVRCGGELIVFDAQGGEVMPGSERAASGCAAASSCLTFRPE